MLNPKTTASVPPAIATTTSIPSSFAFAWIGYYDGLVGGSSSTVPRGSTSKMGTSYVPVTVVSSVDSLSCSVSGQNGLEFGTRLSGLLFRSPRHSSFDYNERSSGSFPSTNGDAAVLGTSLPWNGSTVRGCSFST